MRVLINGLAPRGGGGASYLRGIVPALGMVDPGTHFLVVRSPWQRFWDFDVPENVQFMNAPLPDERSTWKRLIWEQQSLPGIVREHHIDVIFCPNDIATLFSSGETVLAIKNLNVYIGADLERGPGYYLNRKILLRTMSWISARKASRVEFASNYLRSIVCSQLGIPLSKTEVIYHGLRSDFSKRPIETPDWIKQLPKPYILAVSAVKAHKNFPFLIRSFVEVIRRTNLPHHIVVAGHQEFQPHIAEMRSMMEKAGMEDRLHLLGVVSYQDLPSLYQNADLFVFPSLIESFGHPLVEAMASGTPVVVANTTVFPEICGDAAVYFDPTDLNETADQICRVLCDPSLKAQLVDRGLVRAAEFSWEKAAQQNMALFNVL